MQLKANRQAFRIALIYVIVAGGWILSSDELLKFLVRNPDERVQFSIFKGWAFVILTGGLLHLVVRRLLRRWEHEAEQRRLALEQLRASEEQLRLVLEASADGLWDWNLKTGTAYLSPRYCELSGYAANEVVAGLEFLKRLVHPEDWSAVQAVLDDLLAGKSTSSAIEYRMITKTGAVKWIWGRGKVVERAADGSPLRMVGTISDITERKGAKEALRDSEQKYRVLFESSRDAIMTLEPATGRFTSGNPATLKLFGAKTEGEFLASNPTILSPERQPDGRASADKVRELIETTLREGSHFFEWTHRRINGEEFSANVLLARMEWSGTTVIQATVRDITGQRLAERQTAEAINYIQTLLAASPIGIITYQASGQAVSANEAAARLVGTTVENVKRQNFRELESWKQSSFLKLADAALKTGREQTFENHTVSSYGVELWLACRFVPFFYEGSPHLMLLAQDISDRKQMESSRSQLATVVEQCAETIVITDLQGTILYANPAFEKTTGYTCAEAIGQNPRVLKSGKQGAEFYRQMWEVLGRGEVWHGHFMNRRKDGTLYEEDATISPVRDAAGKVVNYAAVKRDVTHEVELEHHLRQAQKMDGIGQLAGGVAHDFNNILSATLMHLGLLQQSPQLTDDMLESLKEVESETLRAANLTRQLLLFSRRQVANVVPLDLNNLIADLLKMLLRLLGEHIEVAFQRSADPVWVCADAGMLEQVVMNLCINARDAMPKAGRLTLATSVVERGVESAKATSPDARAGRFVCLTVTDNGCGMDEGLLKRIFEPFFTTKEVGKGTGLGLATVYGIVKLHEGWVEVESTVGQGSSFRVHLPAGTRPAGAVLNSHHPPEIRGGSETILLVEDEMTVRRSAALSLRKLGYAVLEAGNGKEALKLWEEHQARIGLLLTDMVMPGGMNGLDLAQRMKAQKASLKIIISSGYSADLAASVSATGPEITYLAKPYKAADLAKTVRRSLDEA